MKPSLKKIVKSLCPPVAWSIAKRLKRVVELCHPLASKRRAFPVGFSGHFATYAEAQKALNSTGHPYESQAILARTEKTTRDQLEMLRSSEEVKSQSLRLYAALASLILSKKMVSVLDYGGAMGLHYHSLRKLLPPDVQLNWMVVELPSTAQFARERFGAPELSFRSNTDGIAEVDIVLASSSLHYSEKPYETLQQLVSLHPRVLILDRTPFLDGRDLRVVIQRVPASYYDASYPCTLLGREGVKEFMRVNGYSLKLCWQMLEESLELDGEKLTYQGLVFDAQGSRPPKELG